MSERKIIRFFKRHITGIIAILVICIIAGYFVNVIFFENKKDVISVLVLKPLTDTEALEKEIGTVVEVDGKEEIHIQSIDFDLGGKRSNRHYMAALRNDRCYNRKRRSDRFL